MRIFFIIILFYSALFCSKNPWIYTNEPEPARGNGFIVSALTGAGVGDDGGGPSFYYASLNRKGTTASGFSFSGYAYYDEYWNGDWYSDTDVTNFKLSYVLLKNFKKTGDFTGLFYGSSVGLSWNEQDHYNPLGVSPIAISSFLEEFFDDGNLYLHANIQCGFALKKVLIYSLIGVEEFSDPELYLSFGIAYKTF